MTAKIGKFGTVELADLTLAAVLFGAGAALLVGFSKTGVPGAAIPAVALMAEAFSDDAKLSVGAMVPVLILGDLFAIAYFRRHAQWVRLLELFPYVIAGMLPGYLFLRCVPVSVFRPVLGWIVLGLLLLHVGRCKGWDTVLQRWWFTAISGTLSGFGTAVANAAGPVMSIYLISRRLDKLEFMGTAAWFFFLVNVSKIPFYAWIGVMTPATLQFSAIVAPTVVIGAVLGVRVLKWLPQWTFDTLVLALAGVAAIRLILA